MSMTVSELLTDKAKQAPAATLFSIGSDAGLAEAVAFMNEKGISSVIVTQSGKMQSLITLG